MTSKLYQVPLTVRDLVRFRTPENQPAEDAENCASVSLYLMGLVTKIQAEADAGRKGGVYLSELLTYVNKKHEDMGFEEKSMAVNDDALSFFKDNLFKGFATVVLATRAPPAEMGHYFIIYRDRDEELYAIDPQARRGFQGTAAIMAYLTATELLDEFYYVEGEALTEDGHSDRYNDDILSDLLASGCKVGGKKRRSTRLSRKNGKKTKKGRKHHAVRTRRRRH